MRTIATLINKEKLRSNFKLTFSNDKGILHLILYKTQQAIFNSLGNGIDYPSKLQFNYPRTIDKGLRLIKCLGVVNRETTEKSKTAWNIAFDTEVW